MLMRITHVESIALKHPFGPPEAGITREWTNVLIHTDQGLTGIGRGGNPQLISQDLAPVLIGQDPRQIARLWDQMYESAWRYRGPGRAAMSSIGALDIALWDLYGKACGQPVWRLLGGYTDTVPAYADGIGYIDQSPEEVATEVKEHADLGFDAIKLHFNSCTPQEVLDKVHLSREALGPDKKLMIDVSRAWDGKTAVETVRRLEPYKLYWIEEPVRQDDEPFYMRMVQEATSAIVAGAEGEGTLYGIRRLINEGALQLVQTDILIGGGYTGLMRIAALCEAYHLPIAPHGAQFPDINCHFVAAVPNGLMVPACPSCEPFQIWSKLYDPPFQVIDGQITMTDKPGLGLELDWDFINRHRVNLEA
jgi:L-alanine-DL-glutamate epimerase-like enolase superfamily enzyme